MLCHVEKRWPDGLFAAEKEPVCVSGVVRLCVRCGQVRPGDEGGIDKDGQVMREEWTRMARRCVRSGQELPGSV